MANLERVRNLLACPDCHGHLAGSDGELLCESCNRAFAIRDGVPLLFPLRCDSTVTEGESFYDCHAPHSLKNRLKKCFPVPDLITRRPTLHDRLRDEVVLQAPVDSAVLNLRSGVQNAVAHPALIHFDIYPHQNTDVAGDGHQLPFLAESLDGVWLCAVLEHLRRPFDVAEECFRALKPGGFVLITVPFIQPRHGSPNDYFRYTLDGLRSVCHRFEEIDGGPTGKGPFGTWAEMTVALLANHWRNPTVSYALRFVAGWLLYPVALLDRIVLDKSADTPLAGGFCYLGRKP